MATATANPFPSPWTDPAADGGPGTPVPCYPPIAGYPANAVNPTGWLLDVGAPTHAQYNIDNGVTGLDPLIAGALNDVGGGYCFVHPLTEIQLAGLTATFGISAAVPLYQNGVTITVRLKASAPTTANIGAGNFTLFSDGESFAVTTTYQDFSFVCPTMASPTGDLSTFYVVVEPTDLDVTLYWDAVYVCVDETPPSPGVVDGNLLLRLPFRSVNIL